MQKTVHVHGTAQLQLTRQPSLYWTPHCDSTGYIRAVLTSSIALRQIYKLVKTSPWSSLAIYEYVVELVPLLAFVAQGRDRVQLYNAHVPFILTFDTQVAAAVSCQSAARRVCNMRLHRTH